MNLHVEQKPTGDHISITFLSQLLRNYIYGSTVAVVGVGGVVVFSTL